jgi:endonuclease/exonuclease/phosphatase family metal-dependent hydrolase
LPAPEHSDSSTRHGSEQSLKLRILSWNVHGLPWPITSDRALRMQRIGERMVAEKPDVAVIQEAWPGTITPLLAAAPGYSAHYVESGLGSPAGGLAIFVRHGADWSLDETSLRFRAFTSYAPWHRLWEGDAIAGKGALFAALVHRTSQKRLWIAATHLQARYGLLHYVDVRLAQLRELGTWLRDFEESVVIAGDFNTPSGEEAVYPALAALGIDISVRERERTGVGTKVPTTAWSLPAWIDYVLVRPGSMRYRRSKVRLIQNERMDVPYSDHSALVADITFGP